MPYFSYESKVNIILLHIMKSIKSPLLDDKVQGLYLFQKLSKSFGEDICKQFILNECIALADDNNYRIRKEVAIVIPILCDIVIDATYKYKLYETLMNLSNDTIWAVRNECIQSLSHLCKHMNEMIRYTDITFMYLKLIDDTAFNCKQEAIRHTGNIIQNIGMNSSLENNHNIDYMYTLKHINIFDEELEYKLNNSRDDMIINNDK